MKKRRFTPIILLLILSLLLGGCIKPEEDPNAVSGSTDESPTLPEYNGVDHYYQDAVYVYRSYVNEETLMTGLSKTYLVLANKTYVLGADYEPASLVTLTCPTAYSMMLDSRAAEALYEMLDEMTAAGITDIYVTSAYRSYEYQVSLFDKYLKEEQKTISDEAYAHFGYQYLYDKYLSQNLTKLDAEDARQVVLSYSAAPGTSEHQTGLCLDFITDGMGGKLNVSFEESDAFAWLSQNAYKFGFILRYPEGKESITGYTYEPWHYRFVGREAATDIYYISQNNGSALTLEEYLGAVQS